MICSKFTLSYHANRLIVCVNGNFVNDWIDFLCSRLKVVLLGAGGVIMQHEVLILLFEIRGGGNLILFC